MKLTPVLMVDSIEQALPFWVDRLGFTKTVEVPEGSRLGFVILVNAGAEVMLQTWESLEKDMPSLAAAPRLARTSLFIEVDDFSDALSRMKGCEVALEERTTFYGMREIGVWAPGGHFVCLAARAEK
jgi:uncharacterized glyoxalase superfamily protein PhnB